MEDINEIKDKRTHNLMSAKDIADLAKKEDRLLTDEETKQVDAHLAAAEEGTALISKMKANDAKQAQVQDRLNDITTPENRRAPSVQPTNEPKASDELPRVVHRYGKLKAFTGPGAEDRAYATGMWLAAGLLPPGSMRTKAKNWCRDSGMDTRIQAALGTNVSVSGGNLVPDEMSQAIIDYREKYGIFRQWADVVPMASDHQIIPTQLSVLTASFASENAAITESESTFSQVTLTAKKLGAITRISTELTEDAIISIADRVTYDLAYAFALKEDQCGFTGDGTSTYGGIRGIKPILEDGSHTASWFEPNATHDFFSELDNTDITTTMARLPQWARDGAAFFCSSVAADAVFGRLKAAGGGNTISELASMGISSLGERGIVGAYLGYPIVTSQVLPLTDASAVLNDKVMLLFGNLRLSSMLGERRAITIAISDQRYWELDQVAIRATERIDINNHGLGTDTVAGAVIGLRGSTS